MKTKYKYINFKKTPEETQWICLNNGAGNILGVIEYHPKWRQYVIDFKERCIFNNQCLCDIADFLTQLNEKTKAER